MRSDIQSLVCLVDFSALSRSGLELGIALSRRFKSELLVFHAVNLPGDQIYGSDYADIKPRQHRRLTQARRQMDRLLKPEGDAVSLVVCGDPVEELIRLADSRRVDMIIAPSRGISGLKRLFTGTIVERLVRQINCPVLVTRPKTRTKQITEPCPHHIVAGISMGGQPGIVSCSAMAARMFDAHLHLVHILEAPPDIENEPYEIAQHHLQTDLLDDLMALAHTANMPSDRVTAAVLTGTPGELIDTYAAGIQADLIVVGVHQTGVLKKMLIGSTTEALLRHSPCCILTLPVDSDC
jgi:nucleotide-binding universal stress UspA family protein